MLIFSGFEFPQINYTRFNGKKYRFAYGVGWHNNGPHFHTVSVLIFFFFIVNTRLLAFSLLIYLTVFLFVLLVLFRIARWPSAGKECPLGFPIVSCYT